MVGQKLSFATWIRAVSAMMILLCHFCAQNKSPYVGMLSQVLNVGVQLFFFLSGFLAGYKGIERPYRKWYLKRMKRIYIPFWLFLGVLSVVYILNGLDIFTSNWLMLALGLQGSVVGVWGAEQTWFITVILLCYLLTPVVMKLSTHLVLRQNKALTRMAVFVVCIVPIVCATVEEPWVYTVFSPVSLYALACVAGQRYKKFKCFPNGDAWKMMILAAASFCIRFAAKPLWDNTILYDRIIVQYTQMVAACAIFCMFAAICNCGYVPKLVKFLSEYSFEICLYHYMFTVGPISLFGYTGNWVTDCVIVTVVVILISCIAKHLTDWIISKSSNFWRRAF